MSDTTTTRTRRSSAFVTPWNLALDGSFRYYKHMTTNELYSDLSEYRTVRTRKGHEIHFGIPGLSSVAGHQLPSARSITFPAFGETEVTCEICRESTAYKLSRA